MVHYQDLPLLGTLLFSNTREGRPLNPDVGGLALYRQHPPPADATSLDGLADVQSDAFGPVHSRLELLGPAFAASDGSVRVRVPEASEPAPRNRKSRLLLASPRRYI